MASKLSVLKATTDYTPIQGSQIRASEATARRGRFPLGAPEGDLMMHSNRLPKSFHNERNIICHAVINSFSR